MLKAGENRTDGGGTAVQFFSEAQQARLQELKGRRDTLTDAERQEWERLVEAAFDATVARTQSLPVAKP